MKRVAFYGLAVAAQTVLPLGAWAGPHDELIARHAANNGVPESLVRRVIMIESRGNPGAVHAGNFGLMQIRLGTARGLGYAGDAKGLLDAETNLIFAVKYLAGAYRAAGCDERRAVAYYQRGYYGVRPSGCNAPAGVIAVVAKTSDAIKPKLVRTEIIAKEDAAIVVQPAAAPFEPLRGQVSDPQAMQLSSVPMPPLKPEFEATTKYGKRGRHEAEKRAASVKPADTVGKSNPDDPIGVVSFVKKLVTPDKASRTRADEAEADPPSHVQPPL
jgi:soluble lytic murein transglycosylase-like protein